MASCIDHFFSRQKNSSLILAYLSGAPQPCFIVGFAQCTVIFKQDSSDDHILCKEHNFVKVFPLSNHAQQYFFPQPIQVRQNPDSNELRNSSKLTYIHVSAIICRCAYCPFGNAHGPLMT